MSVYCTYHGKRLDLDALSDLDRPIIDQARTHSRDSLASYLVWMQFYANRFAGSDLVGQVLFDQLLRIAHREGFHTIDHDSIPEAWQ